MTMSSTKEEDYYTEFFTRNPKWAMPYPNADEASRVGKIFQCLSRIPEQRGALGERRPLRILDVGCGRGWLTNLASIYGSCDGVEPVAAPVELARQNFPHLNFTVGTTADVLQSPDFRPYDVVISSEVIEHVEDKETFVAELSRCLVPDGHVIITTPRGEEYQKYQRAVPRDTMQPVEMWISEKDLRALFERNRFEAVRHDRAYIDLPGMSLAHDLCARYGSSQTLERLHLKWFMEGLQYAVSIYQVWWFRLRSPAAQ